MNYLVTLKSLGLPLACLTLLPLAQATEDPKPEDSSSGNRAAKNVKKVPEQILFETDKYQIFKQTDKDLILYKLIKLNPYTNW